MKHNKVFQEYPNAQALLVRKVKQIPVSTRIHIKQCGRHMKATMRLYKQKHKSSPPLSQEHAYGNETTI